jgi:hypothetical protein
MTESQHRPRVFRSYLNAVRQVLPIIGTNVTGSPTLPSDRVCLQQHRVDRDVLRRYATTCSFESANRVPATLPHVVATPLHLKLITSRAFPFRALGLVHVANTITVHEPLREANAWDVQVFADRLRRHRRGQVFSIMTEVRSAGILVWSEQSDMLARRRGDPDTATSSAGGAGVDLPERPPFGFQRWDLPASLGREYAKVSGDANPIHLSALTARPFGFRRAIVHGMWELARCLAEIDNRLPDAYTVSAQFKRPIFLPGQVVFGIGSRRGGIDFGLSGTNGTVTHLLGRVNFSSQSARAAPAPRQGA